MQYQYCVPCLLGLEGPIADELKRLGMQDVKNENGRVYFTGGFEAMAEANLNLRIGERVLIELGRFEARSFEELFQGTKALPWEHFIGRDGAFPVKGYSLNSALFSVSDCQKIIKKAIAQRLEEEYGLTWFPEDGVKYQIEFFILKDVATIMIETSGMPLHKRGYRIEANAAPLRETLAAAMVLTSRPRDNVLLWDPCAGSGTIAIEAAMIMCGIAPGIYRRFSAEAFPQIPAQVWAREREAARSRIHKSTFTAYASDIDDSCIKIAEANARRAGVSDVVHVFKYDARNLKRPQDLRGTIVTNPPYGERLMTMPEVEMLYRELGETFRALSPWQIYVLTSATNFERLYGKRADKIKKLYNGMIPCYLYEYFKQDKRF